jgi:Fe-S-cluster containining protein
MSGNGGNLAGCATCKGRCCRDYVVNVSVADVRKIVAVTGLRPADFLYLKERKDDTSGFRLCPSGAFQHLALAKKQGTTGACIFLIELTADAARCGIYEFRPRVCSTFPTMLRNGAVDVRQDTVCGPDAWTLSAMDLPRQRQLLVNSRAAWEEHGRFMTAWNSDIDSTGKTCSPDELYEYVLHAPTPATAPAGAGPEGAGKN